jgi:hypothetical protein
MTTELMEKKTDTVIALKEDKEIENALRKQIEAIQVIEVVDPASFEAAAENKKGMVAIQKAWTGYWEPLRVAASAIKDMILEKRDTLDKDIEKKKLSQVAKAKAWADAEEKKRADAERAAQAEAKRIADEEALAAAIALEKEGTPEAKAEAEAIMKAPPPPPQVILKSVVPKGNGGMLTKRYDTTVHDIKALARAVLAGQVPVQSIQGNDVFLNGQARMLKKTMNYPGVTVNER